MELEHEIANLKQRIDMLEKAITEKPEAIQSPDIMSDLINKYDITASQASDVKEQIKNGKLKTVKQLYKYVDEMKRKVLAGQQDESS